MRRRRAGPELIASESPSSCDATYHTNRRRWREAGGNLQELQMTLATFLSSHHQLSTCMQEAGSHTGLFFTISIQRPESLCRRCSSVCPSVCPSSPGCIQTNVRPLCLFSSSPCCRLHTYLTGCLRQSGAQAPPNVPCKMDLVWCVWKGRERERGVSRRSKKKK